MASMGRCGKHGCEWTVRLVHGVRQEYCGDCEIERLEAERDAWKARAEALAEPYCPYQATADAALALLRECVEPVAFVAGCCEGDIHFANADAQLLDRIAALIGGTNG